MIERLFERLSALASTIEGDARDGPGDHDVERMAAVLLVEVARADGRIDESEIAAIRRAVGACSALPSGEIDALVDAAVAEDAAATSLHRYVSAVNGAFDKPARIRLVEHLWRVAAADGRLDDMEENVVRKIADLLYVKHRDFMQAKLRVFDTAPTGGTA